MRNLVVPFALCLCVLGCSSLILNKKEVQGELENNIVTDNIQSDVLEQDSLIEWDKNSKLKWDYFQGIPDSLSGHSAITCTKTPFNNFTVYDDSVVMDLPCYFMFNCSWKLTTSNSVLNHEQGHFHIAEIVSRKMRKAISNHISIDNDASTKFYQSVVDEYYFGLKSSLNGQYDKETNHGTNPEVQKRWDVKIAKMLQELEVYSSPHVVVKRKIIK